MHFIPTRTWEWTTMWLASPLKPLCLGTGKYIDSLASCRVCPERPNPVFSLPFVYFSLPLPFTFTFMPAFSPSLNDPALVELFLLSIQTYHYWHTHTPTHTHRGERYVSVLCMCTMYYETQAHLTSMYCDLHFLHVFIVLLPHTTNRSTCRLLVV